MAWFDEPDNQVGHLTARLATDANKVHPICGSAMGQIVESMVLLIFSLVVAFVYNWKLTLIVAVFFPVITFASFINVSHSKLEIMKWALHNQMSCTARRHPEALVGFFTEFIQFFSVTC